MLIPATAPRRAGECVLTLLVLLCLASVARADAGGPEVVALVGATIAVCIGVLYFVSTAIELIALRIVAPRRTAFREARLTGPAFVSQLITLPVSVVGLVAAFSAFKGDLTASPITGYVAAAACIFLGAALNTAGAGAIYARRAGASFRDGLLLAAIPTAVRLLLLASLLALWAVMNAA